MDPRAVWAHLTPLGFALELFSSAVGALETRPTCTLHPGIAQGTCPPTNNRKVTLILTGSSRGLRCAEAAAWCVQRELSAREQEPLQGKGQRKQNKQVCETNVTSPSSMESTETAAASAWSSRCIRINLYGFVRVILISSIFLRGEWGTIPLPAQ